VGSQRTGNRVVIRLTQISSSAWPLNRYLARTLLLTLNFDYDGCTPRIFSCAAWIINASSVGRKGKPIISFYFSVRTKYSSRIREIPWKEVSSGLPAIYFLSSLQQFPNEVSYLFILSSMKPILNQLLDDTVVDGLFGKGLVVSYDKQSYGKQIEVCLVYSSMLNYSPCLLENSYIRSSWRISWSACSLAGIEASYSQFQLWALSDGTNYPIRLMLTLTWLNWQKMVKYK